MRFRVRPPKARELPMQARCNFQITGQRVEIRADMMIPYPHTKAWGQVPCEDVAMRIPLPECWIYQFRTEKAHLSLSQLAAGNISLGSRMGSVKSAHRRAGKVGLIYLWALHDIISPIWILTKIQITVSPLFWLVQVSEFDLGNCWNYAVNSFYIVSLIDLLVCDSTNNFRQSCLLCLLVFLNWKNWYLFPVGKVAATDLQNTCSQTLILFYSYSLCR